MHWPEEELWTLKRKQGVVRCLACWLLKCHHGCLCFFFGRLQLSLTLLVATFLPTWMAVASSQCSWTKLKRYARVFPFNLLCAAAVWLASPAMHAILGHRQPPGAACATHLFFFCFTWFCHSAACIEFITSLYVYSCSCAIKCVYLLYCVLFTAVAWWLPGRILGRGVAMHGAGKRQATQPSFLAWLQQQYLCQPSNDDGWWQQFIHPCLAKRCVAFSSHWSGDAFHKAQFFEEERMNCEIHTLFCSSWICCCLMLCKFCCWERDTWSAFHTQCTFVSRLYLVHILWVH